MMGFWWRSVTCSIMIAKIKIFLKGVTMIFKFNKAQLERSVEEKLSELLGKMQEGCDTEIEVWPLEFPQKFSVKCGDDVVVVSWLAEDGEFVILPSPEPESKSKSEPEPEKLGVGAMMESPEPVKYEDVDPIELAMLKYELMSTHLKISDEKKIIFAKEYSRLWSEHR